MGFEAGPFTDHYVKLQLPPADAGYEPPSRFEQIKRSCPASVGRGSVPTRSATGTPTRAG